MKKRIVAVLLAALMGVSTLFTGCGNNATPAPPATGAEATPAPAQPGTPAAEQPAQPDAEDAVPLGDFRYARLADASTLNAHNYMLVIMQTIYAWVHSGLYRRVPSPSGTTSILYPDIASGEPFLVDDAGLVWHIPLRPYAVFHNGTPITAHTFEYSWRMQLDPLLLNSMAGFLHSAIIEIDNAREYFTQDPPTTWDEVGIRVVDDHTLEIRTTRPFRQIEVMTHFLDRSTFPVYEEFYEAGMNEDRTLTTYATLLENWMGAGPFFFEQWVPDALHVYRRNPDHWLSHLFHFETVTARVVPDVGARLILWEQGEIDIFGVTAALYPQFADDPRLHVLTGVMPQHIDINHLNEDIPLLGTLDFRRALYWGIDRGTISGIVNQPPAPTYIGPEAGVFMGDGTRFRDTPQGQASIPPNHGFDPVRARAYFDSAMAEVGAESVSLRFLFSEAVDNQRLAGEFLQQSLPEIFGEGRIEIVMQSAPAAGVGALRNWRETLDWDITMVGWGTVQQRNFPHQAFTHMINPLTRPNTFLPDEFLERWEYAQALAGEIPLNYNALMDIAAELEQLWIYYAINVPVWQGVSHDLYSEHLELPMSEFVPVIGFGVTHARFRQ